jgi:Uma2 family endonuclease
VSTTVAMSLAEYLARPEEHNTEWSQGALIVAPQPTIRHQLVEKALSRLFDTACPPGWVAVSEVGWLLGPAGPYRGPDVVVIDRSHAGAPHLLVPPILAVELLSPHERPESNLAEYAAAGLDHCWTVDLASGVVTVHRRHGQSYLVAATCRPGHVLHVEHPFPIDLDPGELLP